MKIQKDIDKRWLFAAGCPERQISTIQLSEVKEEVKKGTQVYEVKVEVKMEVNSLREWKL